MLTVPFTSPAGKIGTTYEHGVTLTGTGPFTLGEWFLPDGWTASIVGTRLSFSGMATEVETGYPASFEVFSCKDCEPVTLTTTIAIAAGCSYSWSMQPTIAPVGTPIKTTFTPPKGCPPDTVLQLAVFEADGTTPYHPPWRPAGLLVLSVPAGSSTYTTVTSDAGQDLLFKPHSEQSACLQNCTPSNVSQGRIVPALDPCTITYDIEPRVFTADNQESKTTYTAVGPAGCSVKILLYIGNTPYLVGGVHHSFTIPVGEPVTFSTPWPSSLAGSDFNWRPAPTLEQPSCAQACTLQPARVDFDVVASACVIQWDLYPSPVAVGAASALRVLSGPPNCTISFQAYAPDGVTPISGAVINVATNASGVGTSAEGICTSPGTAVWKPVSPQPNACAQTAACAFGRSSFTHVCSSGSPEAPGTCGLTLTTSCIPQETFRLEGAFTTPFFALVEAFNATAATWVVLGSRNILGLPHTFTAPDLGITSIAAIYSKVRLRNSAVSTCVSNEIPRACGVGVPPPPPPAPPPPPPPGACVASLSIDDFSPAPTCGTPLSPSAVPAVAWSLTFDVGPGVTPVLTGAPGGMTGTVVGSQFVVAWPTPTAGSHSFTVTGTQSGCTNCTFPVTLTVAATAACARLEGYTSRGPSAYTPASSLSFNAADQTRTLTVTGTPGQTFQLVSTGSYASSSGTLTIPPGGVWTQAVSVGQAVAGWSTTWTLSAAGGSPVTVCGGFSTITITGDTTLTLSLAAEAVSGGTQYALRVTGPAGTTDVPFTLAFGSSSAGGMGGSSVCLDNSFGVINSLLYTNYGGVGGNTFAFGSGAIPGPYAIAVKLTTLAGVSSTTHQVVNDSNVVVAGECKSVSWA